MPRAALLLACLVAAPVSAGGMVESPKVVLRGDVAPEVLLEALELVEGAWRHWKETFGREPATADLPMAFDIFPDRESFLQGARAAGCREDLSGMGGWTSWEGRVSLLFVQPDPFDTRRLVLHEGTHQFQARAFPADRPQDDAPWHREGLAERFGWHRRTRAGLEVGHRDAVALRHRPQEAAERVRFRAFDPWAIGSRAVEADYTDSLALATTLLETSDAELRERYLAWRTNAFRGGGSARGFLQVFEGMEERLRRAANEVWGRFHRTWRPDGPGWEAREEGLRFMGAEPARLVFEWFQPPEDAAVAATVATTRGEGAGVSIGGRTWWTLLVRGDEAILRPPKGEDVPLGTRPAGATGPVRLRLRLLRDRPQARVEWGGSAGLAERSAEPVALSFDKPAMSVALAAFGGEAFFTEVDFGEPATPAPPAGSR
jgi:hypothetical protein